MATAHLQPLAGVLRVFPDGSSYGAPYSWCCSWRTVGDDTIELLGVIVPPNREEREAIRECLIAAGYRRCIWVRKRPDGTEHLVEFMR